MNILDNFFMTFTKNQKEMMCAIIDAGGMPELVLTPSFLEVLKVLSQNNVEISCLYVKE